MVGRAIAAAGSGVEQLAAEVGVSYGTMWAWARGKRNPNRSNLRRLAEVLGRRGGELIQLAAELEKAAGDSP
jgi:transcriptional regulator with XRE-family HTH domain